MQNRKRYIYKKWTVLFVVIYLVVQSLMLLPPIIMQSIIDTYFPNRDFNNIILGILLFVAIPFLYILAQSLFNYFAITFARNKGNEISITILKNIVYQNMEYFDKQNSMELLSYASKEAVGYLVYKIIDLPKLFANVILSVVILFLLSSFSIYLSLLQLFLIPLAIVPIKLISRWLNNYIQTVLAENAKLNQTRADIIQGINLVKSLNIEEARISKIEEHNSVIVKMWGKVAALDSLSSIWIDGFLSKLFTALSFGLTILFMLGYLGHSLSVGSLVSILAYIALLYNSFNLAFMTYLTGFKKESEYSKLFEYLELNGEREVEELKQEFKFSDKLVFDNVTFAYDSNKEVLNNISFEIKFNNWLGIVGPSGIGKSTIFELLLKLYDPNSGNILVDGINYQDINCFSIRQSITKVAQDIFMFPGTIRDNLLLANPNADDKLINWALETACLSDYISDLKNGIDTEIGEVGKLMSGGQRQRLALAQGLIRKNKFLLLDEITSNLDKDIEHKIMLNLKKLVVEEGYTIVSISHNQEFLQEANDIYEIK